MQIAIQNKDEKAIERILNIALEKSQNNSNKLIVGNEVYIDGAESSYTGRGSPFVIIPENKLKEFFAKYKIPPKHQPLVEKIIQQQANDVSLYKEKSSQFFKHKHPRVLRLYPGEHGYGNIPKSYNMTAKDGETLRQKHTQALTAVGAAAVSPAAAVSYSAVKVTGGSNDTAENTAIITGMAANSITAGLPTIAGVKTQKIVYKGDKYIEIKPENSSTKIGTVKIEIGSTPTFQESQAIDVLRKHGYNITFNRTASQKGIQNVQTADTFVEGLGRVDITTPESVSSATKRIEKKDSQTDVVYIQKDFSLSQQREIIDRVKGKTTIKNIHTVIFENSDKSISIYSIKK